MLLLEFKPSIKKIMTAPVWQSLILHTKEGHDTMKVAAAYIFGIQYESVTKELRQEAKRLCYVAAYSNPSHLTFADLSETSLDRLRDFLHTKMRVQGTVTGRMPGMRPMIHELDRGVGLFQDQRFMAMDFAQLESRVFEVGSTGKASREVKETPAKTPSKLLKGLLGRCN